MTATSAPGLAVPGIDDRRASFSANTALLGMAIFMASWAMLFASLFFSYGLMRVGATAWPPVDLPRLPLGLPAIATALLGLSSFLLQRGLAAARAGDRRRELIGTAGAAALGTVFLVLQLSVWRALWFAGLTPGTGTYASVFYALTAFHAVHVVVGVIALLVVAARVAMTRGTSTGSTAAMGLRLWSLYWHMVGVIWGVMFTLVYLL